MKEKTGNLWILIVIAVVVVVMALAACSVGKMNGAVPDTGIEGTVEETETEEENISAAEDLAQLIEEIYGRTEIVNNISLMDPEVIDITDASQMLYYAGITGQDVEAAVFSEPLISSIPYSLCLVKAAPGADVSLLKEEILNGVNLEKWICVTADKVAVQNSGDVILMVMGYDELTDDVMQAFFLTAPDPLGEKLERTE